MIEEAHYHHGQLEGRLTTLKINGMRVVYHYKNNR